MGFLGSSDNKESACNAGDLGLMSGMRDRGNDIGNKGEYRNTLWSWLLPQKMVLQLKGSNRSHMKYISGCVWLGKKAGIYSLVKGLPQLKHTSTCTHSHLLQDQHVWVPWVPVDGTYPRGREAIGQAAKGVHCADPRWVLWACSCLELGEASTEQVTAAAAGGDGQVWQRGNRWFQEEPGRVNMPTSDHSHSSVLSNCFKFGGTNKLYYCLLKATVMMFHMTHKHTLQWV